MNINISSKIAFWIALLLFSFTAGIGLFVLKMELYVALTFATSIFIFVFLCVKYSFDNYMIKPLEKIFDIIYDSKKNYRTRNSFEQVEEDALLWKKGQLSNIDQLQKQNNYRKEFIGNLSHELKTPLFSIQGYIETLIDGGIDDPKINMAYLKKAVKNIERLSAIINDVDTIAKVESDALNLNKTNFNILELIQEVVESLELYADKSDIDLQINAQSDSVKVNADREKIRRVLINLITNSIKYGKEEGSTELMVSNVYKKVIVSVSDNGIGIQKDQLQRIFERFYRVDSNRSREQGGSGLGLAIVRHILEAHHQNIRVKSEYGQGSVFSFTLVKV